MHPNEYLKALSNGDRAIIKEIYVKTYPKVVTFILKNNGFNTDAEDIFQKGLLQLIARYKVKPFSISDSFEAYFFTVCKNLWRRELNKRKRRLTKQGALELLTEEQDIAVASMEQEKWELFQEKINHLSDNCKTILKLFFKKVAYSEIMDKMEYASDNVLRQRIFKCKKKLTELIRSDLRYKILKRI